MSPLLLRAHSRPAGRRRGFTLIELLLVMAILGVIISGILLGTKTVSAKRRDTRRLGEINQLQRALALYLSRTTPPAYVVYTGCLNGTDPVTAGLRSAAVIPSGAVFADPNFPVDPARCYYYSSADGQKYSIRYTLEADSSASPAGTYTVTP